MRIVFLCTANSARSQIAEGFAGAQAPPEIEVWSAGTWPGAAVHALAVKAMKERGIDISGAVPKYLSDVPLPIDPVVTVCGSEASECPRIPGVKTEGRDLADPAAAEGTEENRLAAFRETRDEIQRRVKVLLERLCHRAAPASGQHSP